MKKSARFPPPPQRTQSPPTLVVGTTGMTTPPLATSAATAVSLSTITVTARRSETRARRPSFDLEAIDADTIIGTRRRDILLSPPASRRPLGEGSSNHCRDLIRNER
ncbi:hypothetical protein [Marichromatium purpuratum]|uniref:hypothetical protein n=1 Tax=Marichromatium purpuratum TaxID=37487 RepID=UPI0018DC2CAA|nr:hypothetical protein [Marichromatium purpuratum]